MKKTFSLLAITAIATTSFSQSVCKIGDTEYESIAYAVRQVEDGGTATVDILADVELTNNDDGTAQSNFKAIINKNKQITVNLNGHTIEAVGNHCAFSVQSGSLTINGEGTIRNTMESIPEEDTDYRRCVWSDENTQVTVNGGYYELTQGGNSVFCFNGDATLSNCTIVSLSIHRACAMYGDYNRVLTGCNITSAGRAVYNHNGALKMVDCVATGAKNTATIDMIAGSANIINSVVTNIEEEYFDPDYRRAIWSSEDATVNITDGQFTSSSTQVLCFNGDASISGAHIENKNVSGTSRYTCLCSGEHTRTLTKCTSTGGVLHNLSGTLNVIGGTYSNATNKSTIGIHEGNVILRDVTATNDCLEIEETEKDYRRAVWSDENASTTISGGLFENNADGTQTICFVGKGLIDGKAIVTNNGTGRVISGGEVKNAKLKTEGDLLFVNDTKVVYAICNKNNDSDYTFVENTDSKTNSEYPYCITDNPTAIKDITVEGAKAVKKLINGKLVIIRDEKMYDLSGREL